jgi:adenylate cyclase
VGLVRKFLAVGGLRSPAPRSAFWRQRFQLKVALLLSFAGVLIAVTLALHSSGALDRWELDSIDQRFEQRGGQAPPDDVVVVAIDDVSFGELDRRFQDWPRTYHARVLRNLARLKPKAVVYDVQFTEPSSDQNADYALYEAAGRARPVVFATTEVDAHGGTGVFGGDAATSARNLRLIHARVGQALLPQDEDGVYRRMGYSLNGLTSLGVVAAEAVSGHLVTAPSGRSGREWIDYAGPPDTIDSVSFSQVYDSSVDPARIRGKVVVVGPTTPTLHDVHPTSAGGGLMPGAEIQANAFETARRGFPLRSVGDALDWILIVAMGLVAPLLAIRLTPLATLPIVVVVALAYLFLAQRLFDGGWIVAVVAPLVALALTTVSSLTVEYFTETRARRRLRRTLGRYAPEAHVERLLAEGRDRLKDEELSATVLFCDLRSFSRFTETLQPTAFMELLNEYLSGMGRAVEDNGGTIVSYQGDGLLAVFGAPVELDDHADRALKAARQMLDEALPRFNRWVDTQRSTPAYTNLPEELRTHVFDMGIGVCSGPLMSGNVGFDERLAYAAVGDATNVASRLESKTKEYPEHRLFVADNTRAMLRHGWLGFKHVGNMKIEGREATTMVWGLIEEELTAAVPRTTGRRAP